MKSEVPKKMLPKPEVIPNSERKGSPSWLWTAFILFLSLILMSVLIDDKFLLTASYR